MKDVIEMMSTQYQILIVDDHEELLELIKKGLQDRGFYNIKIAKTCQEARRVIEVENIDLAVLDINLPDGDGFTLFRHIRESSTLPVLFLSARDEDADRLYGLGLGADDYMTKPFLMEELYLRVQSILFRCYGMRDKKDSRVIINHCEVDFDAAIITKKGQEYSLTALELKLLRKLYTNKNKVVTFDALSDCLWGQPYYGYENSLMVHIRHLRQKIEIEPSKPKCITTVRGLGYKLIHREKVYE